MEVPANESVDLDLLDCMANSIDDGENPENPLNVAVNEEREVEQKILGCVQISVPRRKLLLSLFTCSQCGKVFSGLQQREAHGTCAPSASCVFPACGETFTDFTDLQQHLTKIHRFNPTSLGRKVFKKKEVNNNLDIAALGEKKGKAQCDICKKEFRNKVSLRTHSKLVHKLGRQYTCAYCGKVLYSRYFIVRLCTRYCTSSGSVPGTVHHQALYHVLYIIRLCTRYPTA